MVKRQQSAIEDGTRTTTTRQQEREMDDNNYNENNRWEQCHSGDDGGVGNDSGSSIERKETVMQFVINWKVLVSS